MSLTKGQRLRLSDNEFLATAEMVADVFGDVEITLLGDEKSKEWNSRWENMKSIIRTPMIRNEYECKDCLGFGTPNEIEVYNSPGITKKKRYLVALQSRLRTKVLRFLEGVQVKGFKKADLTLEIGVDSATVKVDNIVRLSSSVQRRVLCTTMRVLGSKHVGLVG